MILSNEPEFSPWVIQPSTEEKTFKENVFDYGISNEALSNEEYLPLDEQNSDEATAFSSELVPDEMDIAEVESTEIVEEEPALVPAEDLYV